METERGMGAGIRGILRCLSPQRRRQLLPLLLLMVVCAIAEMVSLAALVPFLAILADPSNAVQKPFIGAVVHFLGLPADGDMRPKLTLVFSVAVIAAAAVRFSVVYLSTKLNYTMGYELGTEVYRKTLYQPYEFHIARNSSETVGAIDKMDNVVYVISSCLIICSSMLMAIFIMATLILIDPVVAGIAMLGFGSIYVTMSIFTKRRLARNSRIVNRAYGERVQAVQEGLGGIRDVILGHTQEVYARRFYETERTMRMAQASTAIIGGPSSRIMVEALGIILIGLLGYYVTEAKGGLTATIPTLGALALGAQRLMPLMQQAYQGWVYISGNRHVLADIATFLEQPLPPEAQRRHPPSAFDHAIIFDRISFRYQPNAPFVIRGVDLHIPKGSRVGIIGPTGSGKTTAMDLLLGLLRPVQGSLTVDGVEITDANRASWQASVAYVPQMIFLADASIAENIAFGVPLQEIDMDRVRTAAKQAQIDDFIEATPSGYSTTVGERGVRLSGGQRQRIAIARALYKKAKVLVFDEATSALDGETEHAVMESIEKLGRDLTIVLIAHRLATLRGCDVIYRFNRGRIESACRFADLDQPMVSSG